MVRAVVCVIIAVLCYGACEPTTQSPCTVNDATATCGDDFKFTTPLEDANHVTTLVVNTAHLTHVNETDMEKFLENIPNLKTLDLSHTRIQDLSPAPIKSLTTIILSKDHNIDTNTLCKQTSLAEIILKEENQDDDHIDCKALRDETSEDSSATTVKSTDEDASLAPREDEEHTTIEPTTAQVSSSETSNIADTDGKIQDVQSDNSTETHEIDEMKPDIPDTGEIPHVSETEDTKPDKQESAEPHPPVPGDTKTTEEPATIQPSEEPKQNESPAAINEEEKTSPADEKDASAGTSNEEKTPGATNNKDETSGATDHKEESPAGTSEQESDNKQDTVPDKTDTISDKTNSVPDKTDSVPDKTEVVLAKSKADKLDTVSAVNKEEGNKEKHSNDVATEPEKTVPKTDNNVEVSQEKSSNKSAKMQNSKQELDSLAPEDKTNNAAENQDGNPPKISSSKTSEGNGTNIVLGIIVCVMVVGGIGMGYKYWKNRRSGYRNANTEETMEEGKELQNMVAHHTDTEQN